MSDIKEETRNGKMYRYVLFEDGNRWYLAPDYPESDFDIQSAIPINLEATLANFNPENRDAAREVARLYQGRINDIISILFHAQDKGRFVELSQKLKNRHTDFKDVPEKLMPARTDVTALVLELYADLGFFPQSSAENAKRILAEYGPCIEVIPRN